MKTDEEKIGEIKPYENKMDELFLEYFNKLEKSIAYHRNELPKETSRLSGIYVFYNEADKAIYVGRTDDIRSRIHHHTREGSKNGSATYAFNTAKKEFEKVNGKTNKTRNKLDTDQKFNEFFKKHKKALYDSKIRYIEIQNDVLQAMIEPYISFKLGTYPQNQTFENH